MGSYYVNIFQSTAYLYDSYLSLLTNEIIALPLLCQWFPPFHTDIFKICLLNSKADCDTDIFLKIRINFRM